MPRVYCLVLCKTSERQHVKARYYRGSYDGRGSGSLPYGYDIGAWNQVIAYGEQASLVRQIFQGIRVYAGKVASLR